MKKCVKSFYSSLYKLETKIGECWNDSDFTRFTLRIGEMAHISMSLISINIFLCDNFKSGLKPSQVYTFKYHSVLKIVSPFPTPAH